MVVTKGRDGATIFCAIVNAIIPEQHPLLHRMQLGARWLGKDDYPASPTVADEHERWLGFVSENGQLDRFLPRLRDRPGQRDDALAEIKAAYFLSEHCALPICEWEPPGANGSVGEFLVDLPDGRRMFVEVKAPGWEGEVVEAEGYRSDRLAEPKYLHADGRSTAPRQIVCDSVTKAYPKMPGDIPTLLVVCGDLIVSLNDWPHNALEPENGSFYGSAHERLGAVGILTVDFSDGWSGARFRHSVYHNPRRLPDVAVPMTIFQEEPV